MFSYFSLLPSLSAYPDYRIVTLEQRGRTRESEEAEKKRQQDEAERKRLEQQQHREQVAKQKKEIEMYNALPKEERLKQDRKTALKAYEATVRGEKKTNPGGEEK